MCETYENWNHLAAAIVLRAVNDWRSPHICVWETVELREFFRGEWFELLCGALSVNPGRVRQGIGLKEKDTMIDLKVNTQYLFGPFTAKAVRQPNGEIHLISQPRGSYRWRIASDGRLERQNPEGGWAVDVYTEKNLTECLGGFSVSLD